MVRIVMSHHRDGRSSFTFANRRHHAGWNPRSRAERLPGRPFARRHGTRLRHPPPLSARAFAIQRRTCDRIQPPEAQCLATSSSPQTAGAPALSPALHQPAHHGHDPVRAVAASLRTRPFLGPERPEELQKSFMRRIVRGIRKPRSCMTDRPP